MELAAHLLDLETRLHQQDVRANPDALRRLIAEDFVEFGVSGKVWTRDAVIEALHGESFSRREVSEFKLMLLADDVALVTYRGHRVATPARPAADSLRSSVWKRRDGEWQMVFHQGTLLGEG